MSVVLYNLGFFGTLVCKLITYVRIRRTRGEFMLQFYKVIFITHYKLMSTFVNVQFISSKVYNIWTFIFKSIPYIWQA